MHHKQLSMHACTPKNTMRLFMHCYIASLMWPHQNIDKFLTKKSFGHLIVCAIYGPMKCNTVYLLFMRNALYLLMQNVLYRISGNFDEGKV